MILYISRASATAADPKQASWWKNFKQTGYGFRAVAIATMQSGS